MGGLGAYDEPVRFSDSDAQNLIKACNHAASTIDGQAGSRRSWRATGEDNFEGYYSTLFRSNGVTQLSDAGELAGALRQIATLTGNLRAAADAERQRRQKAKEWEDHQKHRGTLEKMEDGISHLWGGDKPPVGPPAPELHHSLPKPKSGSRETPAPGSGGGASSGRSSAIPDKLRSFATSSAGGDKPLETHHTAVANALAAFTSSCGWGSLDASGVMVAFRQYLKANADEVTWANAIAAAFDKAGGSGSICTLSNQALGAALAAAHVSATRQNISIDLPTVNGGLTTSGYADDPVNTSTGNFTEPETDLVFGGGCSALVFTRTYNSVDRTVGAFGPGWSSWPESRLILNETQARWVHADGRHVVFPRIDTGWDRSRGDSYWLVAEGDGLVVSDNSGGRWRFTAAGRLESFDRGAGTRIDVMYQGDGRMAGLVHERGRSVSIEWAGERVAAIVSSDGRRVDYEYDAQGRLTAAAADDGTRRYIWAESGLIEQVVDGDGVVEVVNGYDADGRVAWQRSPFGRTTRYSYLPGGVTEVADTDGDRSNVWIADSECRLIGATDAHGYRQSYSWDAFGNMVGATDRVGRKTVREYDERGRLTRELTPDGAELQFGYDAEDRVSTVVAGTEDGSSVTSYEYEGSDRNPSLIVDPAGGRTALAWEQNLLRRATDPTGVILRFGYDEHGDLVAVTNAAGATARFERDDAGLVTAAVTPLGHRTAFSYDGAGRLVARRDPDGAVWRFEYSAGGRLVAQVAPDGGRIEIGYGENGADNRTTDALGRVVTRAMDDIGNLASLGLPDGSSWSFTHDALSRLVQIVDPTGGSWSYSYDADGVPTAEVDPSGVAYSVSTNRAERAVTVDDGLLSSTLRLDAFGRTLTVSSTEDDAQTYVYDACGRVVEILDPEGALTLIARDAAGRPVKVTDAGGAVTEYLYDSCGRLVETVEPGGGVTTREYDADSRLIRQTLPNGDAAWAKYDACGRVVELHQPGTGTARYSYDACGRIASAIDPLWGIRRFAYDVAGQLTAVTNGLGGVTRFEYDENSRLIRIIDPAGGVTARSWNGTNRLISETDPLGRTTSAGYDAAGRQSWQEGPDGRRISFGYDASGRYVSTSVDGTPICRITREVSHRTETTEDLAGPTPVIRVREWDRAGRLIRDERTSGDAESRGMSWSYDRAGRRTSMVDAFGRVTRYRYDSAGRLESVEHPDLGTVTLGYDAAGQLIAAATVDPSGRRTEQAWEWSDGSIVAHTATSPEGTSHAVIDRDADGRIVGVTRDGVVTRYGYDAAGQLTEAATDGVARSWEFDLNGRLVQHSGADGAETYLYDLAGQLITVRHADGTETTHTYDPNGRRTRTSHPDGSIREYEWSSSGWLAGVTNRGSGDEAETVSLLTDAYGRLAQAGSNTVWWDAAAAVPTLAGVGETAVLPLGSITGIGEQWMTPGWRGVRADHVDPWRVSPAVALPDGLGLTSAGTLTFGSDGARGPLEWLAARAYDPSTYGFLATDPVPPVIGAGWAANAYSYAGNNPLAFSDPTGLHPLNDAEFHQRTQGWLAGAWDAAKDWATTGWGGWALGAVMVVGGGVMMATGFGGPVGAMLLSAGADTLIQKATTGKVDYKEVAVTGLLGGVGDFGVAAKLGLTGVKAAATSGAIAGGVSGGALNVFYYASEPGPVTAGGIVAHFGEGVAVGSVTGAASSGISSAVGDKVDSVATSKLHLGEGGYEPKHAYVPKHAAPPAHPTSTGGRLAGAAAAHVNAGAWSLVNDRANGDADPSGPLRSGLVGTVMGSPQGTYHPAHAAR